MQFSNVRLVLFSVGMVTMALAPGAKAEDDSERGFQYAAKVVCEGAPTSPTSDSVVNVHNFTSKTVTITKNLLSLTMDEVPATPLPGVTPPVTVILTPNQGMAVDCAKLATEFFSTPPTTGFEGFLLITTDTGQLDVTTWYSDPTKIVAVTDVEGHPFKNPKPSPSPK
jgi:hypothetical protein